MTRSPQAQLRNVSIEEAAHDCSKPKDGPAATAFDLPGGDSWGLGREGPRSTVAQPAKPVRTTREPLLGDRAGLIND